MTRKEAIHFMHQRLAEFPNGSPGPIPFKVWRALRGPGLRGFLLGLDDWAYNFYIRHIKFAVKLAYHKVKWGILKSRLWNTVATLVEFFQLMPAAKRVAAREKLPVLQIFDGALKQSMWLEERGFNVDPATLIRLYDKGKSIAHVNQVLRFFHSDAEPKQIEEALANVFGDGKVTWHTAPGQRAQLATIEGVK